MKPKPNNKQAVAKACGVSTATVSLALNNHASVAERTRLRIQAMAQRLGYVPNHAARQLARSRFGRQGRSVERVGLVLFDGEEPLRGVYMAFLAGVEQRVSEMGGMLVFFRESKASPRGRFAGLSRSEVVDGLVLVGGVDDKALRKAKKAGRALVVIGDHHCSIPVHQATVDFRAMGRLAVQHLLALGHRRIGFVGATMRFNYQREIRDGVREAFKEAGLPIQADLFQTREGCEDPDLTMPVRRLVALRPMPTAIVQGEASGTAGVLAALLQRGLKVPDDISLVACESSDAQPIVQGIARVNASMAEVGSAGVDLLLAVAAAPGCPARRVLITPRLVEGWSTIQFSSLESGTEQQTQ